jgi:hypothetical protein
VRFQPISPFIDSKEQLEGFARPQRFIDDPKS